MPVSASALSQVVAMAATLQHLHLMVVVMVMTTRLHQRLEVVVVLPAHQEECQGATLEYVLHVRSANSREMLATVNAWRVLVITTKIKQEHPNAKCAWKE